ncbi:HAMP domain-containing protein [Streptomyces sp. SCUT-3]|uniref:sensor histidine kinase n=1 Tax=Streptomyces sp. SCUT-3 TaxID=2684469 RepID=UPI0015F8A57A|nr:HAMP domain-containing sensor histidine kinase [Streptomyces sp. SCUT-3]QMV24911.1 HAMP domain-containing protein [Streptomyces sp. SCUT-3]
MPAEPAPAAPPPPSAPPKPLWDPRPQVPQRPWLRPTIRFRLTVLYGGMFMMAGVVLLAVVYLLVADSLQENLKLPIQVVTGNVVVETPFRVCSSLTDLDDFNRCVAQYMDFQISQALNDLLKRSLLVLVVLTAVAFAFGYVMAGRVLRPLGRITRTARGVAGSDLHRRIELDGPDDELKELADTFDDMLDRLDRAFDSQRRFVANASHELRTPLAINRTLLEVQLADPNTSPDLQQLGRTLLATNERSEQLVEGLLLLARSENELTDRKPVDLAEACGRALDQVREEAGAKGVELRSELAPAVVQGNGVLLERIALNLLQNAVRYNTAGGWVQVRTEVLPGRAELTVSNTGPTVPAYEVDSIFEPFRRLRGADRTQSDKGVGLGLSIVRSVTRAHGGAIAAEPREGGGLVVRVAIPL